MYRSLIVIIFLFSFSHISNAQINGIGKSSDFNILEVKHDIDFKQNTQNQMKKSRFNYYLDESWQAGVFFTKSNEQVNGLLYRYNIYTDQIELRSVIDHQSMEVVSIGTKKFIFTEFYNEDSTLDEGYFELLVSGECKLLIRRSISYQTGRDQIEAYGSTSATNFIERYYLKKGSEAAVIVNKSKESIANVLSDKNGFNDYIDDKLLIFITEKKLMEIIKHYNNI